MPTLITEIALQVHSDLLEAYYSDLEVRENITALEVKRIEATKQALCCYHLLHARERCEQALAILTEIKTSELSKEALEERAGTLTEVHTDLMPLDEVDPLARMTLAGLGLPATIAEFEDYDGNRCRIKLN